MPNTYTQILYHITFSTKERRPEIVESSREQLFKYVWGIHKNLNCHLYRVNAVEDHIHILTHLRPSLALADYIRELKTGTTKWIRDQNVFSNWYGWQDGYGAFTLSFKERDSVIEYIKAQQEHHRSETFLDEFKRLLTDAGIEFDSKYLD